MGFGLAFYWKQCWLHRDVFITAVQCSSRVQAFSASHSISVVKRHKRLGGRTAGTVNPNWPKGYLSYHMTAFSTHKSGGRKGKTMVLSFQVTVTHDGALLSWRWLNICRPIGSGEKIPCFTLPVWMDFLLYLLNCLYLRSFLTSTLLVLSPTPL